MTTAVILQSGRFTATPSQLLHALDAHRKRLDKTVGERDSKVILLTEMSPGKYDNALVDWADENGWHVYHPTMSGPDECAILSARPFVQTSYFLLTHLLLSRKMTGRTAPLFVTAAKPKSDGWFGVWHSPAHNKGLRPGNWATRVYLSALDGLRRFRHRVFGLPTLAGDWNADARNRNFRREISERFPRMKWAGDDSQRPTEGGRVIDGFLTRRRVVVSAKTLRALPGFDHKAVLTVLG